MIDREIRRRMWRPYDSGYSARSTAGENNRAPLIDTRVIKDITLDDDWRKVMPKVISLEVKLNGRYVKDPRTRLYQIVNDTSLEPVHLYGTEGIEDSKGYELAKESMYEAIELVYLEKGSYISWWHAQPQGIEGKEFTGFKLHFPHKTLLGEYPFYCTDDDSLIQNITFTQTGCWTVSEGAFENTLIQRPYGGYFKPGLPLDKIEQVYFSITGNDKGTLKKLTTTSFWFAHEISPPEEGIYNDQRIRFDPRVSPPYPNLATYLKSGSLEVYLQFGVNFEGKAIFYRYQAYDFTPIGKSEVEIHFRRKI